MINFVYQLVSPQFFSVKFHNLNINDRVLIRPRYMAICHADQRYYLGNRDIKALGQKLPMALIHECCGEVLVDKSGTFKPGENVVLIPNSPSGNGQDYIFENYQKDAVFRSSGSDGFLREFVDMPADRLVSIGDIPPNIACISEFFSCAVHAINRLEAISHKVRDHFGVWGDGSLSYVVCCALKSRYPNSKITLVGKNPRKMSRFSFVDESFLNYELPNDFEIDHAFECVGGEGCYDAIDDIISFTKPQGTVMLMGVSENKIAISTRLVLEKGLTLVGSSRSGRIDFEQTVEMMKTQRIRRRLSSIIYEDSPVKDVDDLHRVFATDLNTPFKTVFEWKM